MHRSRAMRTALAPDPAPAAGDGLQQRPHPLRGFRGNFYAPSFFGQVQETFASLGVAALRVNNRGHDLAYNSARGRAGAAYEVLDDSRYDWRAWLDYAESQGWRRVLLWGHSLGA